MLRLEVSSRRWGCSVPPTSLPLHQRQRQNPPLTCGAACLLSCCSSQKPPAKTAPGTCVRSLIVPMGGSLIVPMGVPPAAAAPGPAPLPGSWPPGSCAAAAVASAGAAATASPLPPPWAEPLALPPALPPPPECRMFRVVIVMELLERGTSSAALTATGPGASTSPPPAPAVTAAAAAAAATLALPVVLRRDGC
eukprot:286948-Chlamydomonas_euryale.AAC.2